MRPRWTRGELALALLLVLTTAGSGLGVYLLLASRSTAAPQTARRPTEVKPAAPDAPINRLPGTLYLAQGGALYQLQGGRFAAFLPPAGWTQPAMAPGSQEMVAVKRGADFSDLFLVGLDGQVRDQLTQDDHGGLEKNHWAFYPRFAPDGKSIFLSYDSPKAGYEVDFSVWSMPIAGDVEQGVRWTAPNSYTGGDVQPLPLASGALLYAKYSLVNDHVTSQIWISDAPGSPGRPLTPAEQDCSQPALSPDGSRLAMVCSGDRQSGTLVVAAFDGGNLGAPLSVASGRLLAQPTWAPDGTGLVYLAPAAAAGLFQLWWVGAPSLPAAAQGAGDEVQGSAGGSLGSDLWQLTPGASGGRSSAPTPPPALPAPVQLTQSLDLDATSTIAWR
jgi:hypothetical protein